MVSYISAIGTAVPQYRIAQRDIADFMTQTLSLSAGEQQRLRALYRASGIAYRHSVIPDYGRTQDFTFFPNTPDLSPFPGVRQRMQLYREEAIRLSMAAALDCFAQIPDLPRSKITHLLYVSCTGLYAPGVDITLVQQLGLSAHVQRTAINFMGCYAAFNALKLADSIVRADPDAKVLIVCTELCTIHFQQNQDADTLLANALFADGAAATVVSQERLHNVQFSLDQFHCDLVPDGQNDMAWEVGPTGFEMKLSAYVPTLIEREVQQVVQRLMRQLLDDGKSAKPMQHDRLAVDYYAVHPGGKRILRAIEEMLELPEGSNRPAYEVLRNYGNMSSPTILFVLRALQRSLTTADRHKRVLGLAFGPGLTIESMLLHVA